MSPTPEQLEHGVKFPIEKYKEVARFLDQFISTYPKTDEAGDIVVAQGQEVFLAGFVIDITDGQKSVHPVLDGPGISGFLTLCGRNLHMAEEIKSSLDQDHGSIHWNHIGEKQYKQIFLTNKPLFGLTMIDFDVEGIYILSGQTVWEDYPRRIRRATEDSLAEVINLKELAVFLEGLKNAVGLK